MNRYLKQTTAGVVAAVALAGAAQAHVNPTAAGYAAALNSCDRVYGGGPGTCDLKGGALFGRHSYKAFVFWHTKNGTICRATYLVSHDSKVLWHHKASCGGRRP